MRDFRNFLIYTSLLFFLFSCTSNAVYENYEDIPDNEWAFQNPVSFEFVVDDASTVYSVDYYVRNTLDYPFNNLYVNYSLENAKGDTLRSSRHESILFDQSTGKPFGKTAGDFYDHEFALFPEFTFPDTGTYTFTMKQYMRVDTLQHVYAVGLKVAKAQPE